MQRPQRFATIDALRGLAAICVLLFHAGPAAPIAMPGGFLAVDLFFALSGFVIAHSYGDRLRTGMGLRQFLMRRIIRLWPMVMLGGGLGIALLGGNAVTLLLLPDWRSSVMYPSNPPFWSLLAEMIVNTAFAALLLTRRRGMLIIMAAGAGIAIGILAGIPLADAGAKWSSFPVGLARTVFSFGAGVAIYALWHKRGRAAETSPRAFLPLLGAVSVFALVTRDNSWIGLMAIVLLVPLATWAAAKWEMPWQRPAAWLGDLSFPLYCIHMPLLAQFADAPATGIAALCAVLIIGSWIIERLVDRPARRLLARLQREHTADQTSDQTRIGIRT